MLRDSNMRGIIFGPGSSPYIIKRTRLLLMVLHVSISFQTIQVPLTARSIIRTSKPADLQRGLLLTRNICTSPTPIQDRLFQHWFCSLPSDTEQTLHPYQSNQRQVFIPHLRDAAFNVDSSGLRVLDMYPPYMQCNNGIVQLWEREMRGAGLRRVRHCVVDQWRARNPFASFPSRLLVCGDLNLECRSSPLSDLSL